MSQKSASVCCKTTSCIWSPFWSGMVAPLQLTFRALDAAWAPLFLEGNWNLQEQRCRCSIKCRSQCKRAGGVPLCQTRRVRKQLQASATTQAAHFIFKSGAFALNPNCSKPLRMVAVHGWMLVYSIPERMQCSGPFFSAFADATWNCLSSLERRWAMASDSQRKLVAVFSEHSSETRRHAQHPMASKLGGKMIGRREHFRWKSNRWKQVFGRKNAWWKKTFDTLMNILHNHL